MLRIRRGAIIRERSATLSVLKKEMADAYIARMQGKKLFAVAERIENGKVHFLTENYLRGVLPVADYPSLRRGQRFDVEWDSALLGSNERTAVSFIG